MGLLHIFFNRILAPDEEVEYSISNLGYKIQVSKKIQKKYSTSKIGILLFYF